jgi:site-specific DNA-methyltransferase (adenine-specific)
MLNSYFESKDFALYLGDAIEILNQIDEKSVDLIFADPPYFLSNDGIYHIFHQ